MPVREAPSGPSSRCTAERRRRSAPRAAAATSAWDRFSKRQVRAAWLIVALSISGGLRAAEVARPAPLRSGIDFASDEVRAMQRDDFANPGMLWVTRGETLWRRSDAGGERRACADCHGDAATSMQGVAAAYPRVERPSGRLVNLSDRVNACRVQHQGTSAFAAESDDLLAISAYVAYQARGTATPAVTQPEAQPHLARGRERYYRRIGQLNLACAHCHQQNWGKRLLAQTISQGHGNAYPAYRLEWQTLGSLQRRLRACYFGVRAEMPPYGAPELLELELYLRERAAGLPIESPGVRR
jgi:sulfur-oxidizing protein SoxA